MGAYISMRYITRWKYNLGDGLHKKAFATLRGARHKFIERRTERDAFAVVDSVNELDRGRIETYVKGVDEYREGKLRQLPREILQELVVCRDVAPDILQKMAADLEAREPRARGLADAVGRVRGVLEQLNE